METTDSIGVLKDAQHYVGCYADKFPDSGARQTKEEMEEVVDFVRRMVMKVSENWMIDGYYCNFCQLGVDYKGDKTEHPKSDTCIVPRCIELAEMLKGEKDKP